jgi:hypothetical protein
LLVIRKRLIVFRIFRCIHKELCLSYVNQQTRAICVA